MKFDYSKTINVPVEFAFAQASDFQRFEEFGIGNISPFVPVGTLRAPEIGARWKMSSEFQGRERRYSLELREFITNERVVLGNESGKFNVNAAFSFVEAGPEATLFGFALDAGAKSITGRLILQTLQLARGRIESKMTDGFARMTSEIETAYENS